VLPVSPQVGSPRETEGEDEITMIQKGHIHPSLVVPSEHFKSRERKKSIKKEGEGVNRSTPA